MNTKERLEKIAHQLRMLRNRLEVQASGLHDTTEKKDFRSMSEEVTESLEVVSAWIDRGITIGVVWPIPSSEPPIESVPHIFNMRDVTSFQFDIHDRKITICTTPNHGEEKLNVKFGKAGIDSDSELGLLLHSVLEALENSAIHDNTGGKYAATCPACGHSEREAHAKNCTHIAAISRVREFSGKYLP